MTGTTISFLRIPALPRTPPLVFAAVLVLLVIVLAAIFAPLVATHDPNAMAPALRFRGWSADHWLGTDGFGRDIYSRLVYGARASLFIGVAVTVLSIAIGLFIGLICGYFSAADMILMRFMDGLMAIPGILLAIAAVSLWGASLASVIFAIALPEIPRVVRLTRSVVLATRHEPYVEAAVTLGTPSWRIVLRHLMPNTVPSLIVQATYVCASAIMVEAILSFIGAGLSAETPTWGNMIADGRLYFQIRPEIVFVPAALLSLCVLAMNTIGDEFRDRLDPRLKKGDRRGG
jgi:peptide/nickel transport system permease protein